MVEIDSFNFFNDFDATDWFGLFHAYGDSLLGWARNKYHESPALMFGVAVALAVPVLALSGVLLRTLSAQRRAELGLPAERTVRTRPASSWRQAAYLEFADSSIARFKIDSGMVRIGRERDNDLCMTDPTLHRYHAVLERTPDAEYYIAYVGDPDRDGLFVDGQPFARKRLRGGEVLQIGAIKLRFTLSVA